MSGEQKRPFAVFDLDGTLIRWQLYHALADELARRGHIRPKSYQAMREARLAWKKRSGDGSFKNYEKQVVKIYEAMLKTLSFGQLEEGIDAVFDEYKDQVYTYSRDLIAGLKAKGYLLFAISGSQSEIVDKVAKYYGFDDYVGTEYERKTGAFSGNVTVGSFYKDRSLVKMVKKHQADYEASVGVGDSRSDISMLELVEQPIAFNPELELFDYAKEKGWKIVIERKNVVFELEYADGRYRLDKTD